ncbi:MAG TPA: undecaprenyl-phosphate galactose phosphotransferase WbaP [Gammaproteobacteria bacterium]|nr:undecaprenyl-phosphate galactose phosphotransferase WbaP [Gammaproteobacteria bacterium]
MINEELQARIAAATQQPVRFENNVVEAFPVDLSGSHFERLGLYLIQRLRDSIPTMLVALADFCGLLVAAELAMLVQDAATSAPLALYFSPTLLAYSAIMTFAYGFIDVYSGVARSGPDELRRLTLMTTILVMIIASVTYFASGRLPITAYALAWAFALFAIPLGRAAVRAQFGRRDWWGRKAVLFANDIRTARRVIKSLREQPRMAVKPIAIMTGGVEVNAEWDLGLPVLHGTWAGLIKAKLRGIDHAIIAMPNLNDPQSLALIRRYEFMFKHWTIVPYFVQTYSMWLRTNELNGLIAMQLTHRLFVPTHRAMKRVLDIVLTLMGSIVLLPIGLLIALAIKVDSKGPVFYGQKRLGHHGETFRMLKFRSMIQNADEVLEDYLAEHPEMRDEWNENQKLKKDPRITGLGRFLRRTSLDELPQLLNVLRGEMSLVGPRPCMTDQREMYDWTWEFYTRVRPGITGQWQVSARNSVSFRERTTMDAFYIRNWSVWLDLYILAKTIPAVLRHSDAY